jgi:two-component system, NarL family, response regulator NreC
MNYKILIADDHALVRKGMKAMLLGHNPDWEIFEAENGIKAVMTVNEIGPDMVLMDFDMPKLDGLKAARQIREDCPGIKIIMVTQHSDAGLVFEFQRAGMHAFINKNASDSDFLSIILQVKSGHRYTHIPDYQIFLSEHTCGFSTLAGDSRSMESILSDREREIFRLMISGVRPAQISERLSISPRTLDTHKLSIFRKCKVHSTQELLSLAYKEKLFAGE